MKKLWAELVVLFVVLPVAVLYWINHFALWLMPILGGVGLCCLALLLADKQFHRVRLWQTDGFWQQLRGGVKLFLPWASLTTLLVYLIKPDLFLQWPLNQPWMWVSTLLIYPVVSVIPQEIIFRTYFFHRYKQILPSKNARWAMSTCVFGLAHMVYGNWVAVLLSFAGGAMFGYRYMQTRSTPVVVAEHALWGSFMFTIGLGSYLVLTPP